MPTSPARPVHRITVMAAYIVDFASKVPVIRIVADKVGAIMLVMLIVKHPDQFRQTSSDAADQVDPSA